MFDSWTLDLGIKMQERLFFTADLHLNHKNIIKHSNRPFNAVEEMNEHLIEQIKKICTPPNSILYIIGDFVPFEKDLSVIRNFELRLGCAVEFIRGNHDDKKLDWPDYLEITTNGQFICMGHYAMAVWNKSHYGSWNLYGHSHGSAEDYLDRLIPGRKSIDVGVDNAKRVLGEYRPFSFYELRSLMDKKQGSQIDHHVR